MFCTLGRLGAIFVIFQSPSLFALLAPLLEGEAVRGDMMKYSIFPPVRLWNMAECGRMPKPQAKIEMWKYLWFWVIYLPVLLLLWWGIIDSIWYLSFPHGVSIFKIYLYSGVCCKEAICVGIHILVQVTKTYCLLLGEFPFRMELYWILVKIFMYIRDEFLKFMNIVSQKYRL